VRKRLLLLSLTTALLVAGLPRAGAQLPEPSDPAGYVDPMIGTLGPGFVFPGPAAPFGMVQLSPDTDGYLAYTGYMYSDAAIRGFSHHHIESMGVKSNGNLPFMPTVGPIQTDPRLYSSRFEHATEEASPGYYSVLLADNGVRAELTAGTRVGMHRYTFPPGPASNLILDVGRSNKDWEPWNPDASLHPASVDIVGDDLVVGSADSDQGYTIHFAARFDRPFARWGTWSGAGATPQEGAASAEGRGAGAYVGWDTMRRSRTGTSAPWSRRRGPHGTRLCPRSK
jgi:putative alpha-1,2-mannosidase